jgi:transcriptional regulator with XRE-family HTH domain
MEYPVLDAKATGARIKELREEHHLKVVEVSQFMGFESEQAVYKWQRGESLPTVDNLYALSKLFNTPVDDILRGSREEDVGPSFLMLFLRSGKPKSFCVRY